MKSDGPDSFRSFIVAAACCVIFCLMNGTIRISGLLLVSIMSVFNIGREQASFPFVFNVTMRFLAGPLAGLLARKIGIRFVVVFGCYLACLGVGAGFFAKNILDITIFWGVLYGIGRGFATSVLMQVLNLYFIKHAGKIYGIVYAAEAISGFVLPPVVEHLLKTYGLPGTFLIVAGILLHCLALVILTKEPNFKIQSPKVSDKNLFDIKQVAKKKNLTGLSVRKFYDPALKNIEQYNGGSESSSTFNQSKVDLESSKKLPSTDMKIQGFEAHPNLDSLDYGNYISLSHVLQKFSLPSLGESSNDCSDTTKTKIFALECEGNESDNTFSDRKTSKEISIPEENNTSCLNDLSIFWDPLYISISVCVGFTNVFLAITPTIIVDYAIDKGISVTDTTYLLMAYSIAYLIGSIVIGWIIDYDWLPKAYFSTITFFISAVNYILLPISKSFPMVMLVVILDGMSVSAMFPIYPALVTDHIVKEKQTVAMASLGFLFVPLSFTIPPLIGYFRDHIGSYDYLLYVMCATATSCCVLSLCIPRIANRRTANSKDI